MAIGTLYSLGRICPFTIRVIIAAAEMDLDIDVVYGDQIPERLKATYDSWPVFEASDGAIIEDSAEAVELLINASPRGDAYRVAPELIGTLNRFIRSMSRVILAGKPKIQKQFRPELETVLTEMGAMLSAHGGAYLAGPEFSQAEGHIVGFLQRMAFVSEIRVHYPAAFQRDPALRDWLDRVTTHRSFAAIAPTTRQLRAFYEVKAQYGKPMKIGRLHHSAFRAMWDDMQSRLERLAASETPDREELREVRGLSVLLFRAVVLHAKFETLELFPTLAEAKDEPDFTRQAEQEHTHEADEMNHVLALFDEAIASGERQALETLAKAVGQNRDGFFAHLAYEEATFFPVLSELSYEIHIRLLKAAYQMCLDERPHLIGTVVAYMPMENRISFVDSLSRAVETDHPQWRLVMGRIHQHLDGESWLRIARRFEDIVPVSLKLLPAGHNRPTLAELAAQIEEAFPLERLEIPASRASEDNVAA